MNFKIYNFLIIVFVLYLSYLLCEEIPGNSYNRRGRFCANPVTYIFLFSLMYFYLFFIHK